MNIDRLKFRAWLEVPIDTSKGTTVCGFYIYDVAVLPERNYIFPKGGYVGFPLETLKESLGRYRELENEIVERLDSNGNCEISEYLYAEPITIEQCTGLKDKSGAKVDINQGLDARLLDDDIIRLISTIRLSRIHFAWDNPNDELQIIPKIRRFAEMSRLPKNKIGVYVLTNFNTTFEEDLYRVEVIREFADPYIMIYDKQKADRKYKDLQRYVNNKFIFRSCENFRKYKRGSQWQDQVN